MKILNYDEKTFKQILKENKIVILKFGTKWCLPCKELHKNMLKDKSEFLVIEIDAEEYEDLSREYKVKCFPTLIFFKNEIKQKDILTGNKLDKILEYIKTIS